MEKITEPVQVSIVSTTNIDEIVQDQQGESNVVTLAKEEATAVSPQSQAISVNVIPRQGQRGEFKLSVKMKPFLNMIKHWYNLWVVHYINNVISSMAI